MRRTIVALLVVLGCLGRASAAGNADVVGAWRLEGSDGQGRPHSAVLYLKELPGGALTGHWNMRAGSIELHDVRYEEGVLSFWFHTDTSQTLVRLTFSATVEGNTFQGQLKEPYFVSDVKGKRIEVKASPKPPPD